MGWVGLALSAVSAVSQMGQGKAAKLEANINAASIENSNKFIDFQKGIEFGQYQRLKGQVMGKSVANVAASGIKMTGSPVAVMLDAQTQIEIDQTIGQFNYETSKRENVNQANALRRSGKAAQSAAYTNAFSTMLQGAYKYGQYKEYVNTTNTNLASATKNLKPGSSIYM